jgi:hypothetical protein
MADRRGFLATLTAAAMAITFPGIGVRAAPGARAGRNASAAWPGGDAEEQDTDLNRQLRSYRRQVARDQGVPAPDEGGDPR